MLFRSGAGAQREIFAEIIKKLLPRIERNEVVLMINVGDHLKVWEGLLNDIPQLKDKVQTYFNDWERTQVFANHALEEVAKGIHVFYNEDIFAAVYSSNLLMRSADILVTKPSELAFYPVPKLMIKRVGGHEAWGAIRVAEIGDGTLECDSVGLTLQMLDLMLDDKVILKQMCDNILKANEVGVYNGAYRVVELAIQNKSV